MVSQTEFDRVASEILRDVNAMMTKMQTYKKHLQSLLSNKKGQFDL